MKYAKNKKYDIQQDITNRIIKDLKKGTPPWSKPWFGGIPMNAVTKKPYRGINVLMLQMEGEMNKFKSSRWLTFKQVNSLGGKIKKGSHGSQVVFNQPFNEKKENKEGEMKTYRRWFMRYYHVFNLDKIEGLDKLREKENDIKPMENVMEVFEKTGAKMKVGGDRACYSPKLDLITMPSRGTFNDTESYHQTLLHELVHWTGHDSRLKREIMNQFGSDKYANEELIAELGAAFLSAHFGMAYNTQHASYIHSWLKALEEDKRAIFKAAGKAQKAMDFILGTKVEMIDDVQTVKEGEPLEEEEE